MFSLDCVDVVVIDEHAHDLGVNRNGLLAEVDRGSVRWLVLTDSVPGVVADVLDRVSLSGVRVQNIAYQVLGLLG